MAKNELVSKETISRWKTILGGLLIFGIGYFGGMNHPRTAKVYVETEPQRKEVALKTIEVSKNVFEKTVEVCLNAIHFIGDKLSSVGKEEAKKSGK